MDDGTLALVAVIALQALQLAQTTVLKRVVRDSLRPPPAPRSRGTPVVYEGEEQRADPTPTTDRKRAR